MKLTNRLGLPQYLVDWLENDDYDYDDDPNTISATSLLKPTRQRILTLRHQGEVEADVSEFIASRLGNAIHDSIERISTPGVQKETRVSRYITVNGVEYKVTGKYDVLIIEDDGSVTIRDIKTTSVWGYIYGGKDNDYRNQMSIYRWLLSEENEVSDTGYIDFFFTDWQKVKARNEKDYPKHRLHAGYPLKLLEPDVVEGKIRKKLEILQEQEGVSDDDLPRCTPHELWASPDTWAVYKKGNKRASKVCDSLKQAEDYITTKKMDTGYIQHRPGKVKRCLYCSGLPFCNQATELINNGQLDL